MYKAFLLLVLLCCYGQVLGQDTVLISDENLNTSISNQFTLYKSEKELSFEEFSNRKNELEVKHVNSKVGNIDFTTSTYFIEFVLLNDSKADKNILLETARPITNIVELQIGDRVVQSGDGIPFYAKDVFSNKSLLPLTVKANTSEKFILKLGSDGEVISLPMIFWEESLYRQIEVKNQFAVGVYYGIFLFVILIYLTFYFQLKDPLFLLYSVYVLFTALLQFSLDGYAHQYLFTSGGYMTQHIVIIVAGLTVFSVLQYATRYLELTGRTRSVTLGFSWIVLATVLFSLIPGLTYEISYPLINGFSLLAIIYLLFVAFKWRKKNTKISALFFIGLITLLAGAVIFILGNFGIIDIPSLTQNSLKVSTLIEIICLSILMAGKYRVLQEEKEQAQRRLLVELEEKNRIVSESNVRLEEEVVARTKEIEQQRVLLKEKNEDFVASIKYAERIQKALLSNEQKFKSILPESFIYNRPKDIVSGDFYWVEKIEPSETWPKGLIVYATADCTGHGVPGAFVSIICDNLLKLGKNQENIQTPGEVLDFVSVEINNVLNSNFNDEQIRDGMDIALCAIDAAKSELHFSGAKNGVIIVRDNEVITLKGDRMAIGYSDNNTDFKYSTQTISLHKEDMLYTLSDGYVDQFGGPKHKKFMSKRLKEMLVNIAESPMIEQLEIVNNTFENWTEGYDQIDDVLLIGVRLNN